MMKKTILFFLLSIVLVLSNSCKKDDLEEVYTLSISQFSTSSTGEINDLAVIERYFSDHNVRKESFVLAGESKNKLDERAIAIYEENVAKINESALAEQIRGRTSFTYSLSRGEETLRQKKFSFNEE